MSPKKGVSRSVRKNITRSVQVPIHWGSADDLPTLYANQMLITHAGAEFYLIFGELVPPLVLDAAQLPTELEIKPVAKLAISREAMIKFADAIQGNVNLAKLKFAREE